MKNPAMQHCFLMSHLSLSLLHSLPCRERDGSCPTSPSEQLLLEQSEEIRPRRSQLPGISARPPALGLPATTPVTLAAATTGETGTPFLHSAHSTGPPTLAPDLILWGQEPCCCARCARELEHPGDAKAKPAERGVWHSVPAKPKPRSWWESHIFRSPLGWGTPGPGSQIPGSWLRRKEVAWGMGHGSIPVEVQAEEGLAEVRSPMAQAPPAPSAPQQCSSCPQEPGHGTRGIDCQSWDPRARASGAQPTELGDHPGGTPRPGRAPGTPAGTGFVGTAAHG